MMLMILCCLRKRSSGETDLCDIFHRIGDCNCLHLPKYCWRKIHPLSRVLLHVSLWKLSTVFGISFYSRQRHFPLLRISWPRSLGYFKFWAQKTKRDIEGQRMRDKKWMSQTIEKRRAWFSVESDQSFLSVVCVTGILTRRKKNGHKKN
jgi:hypothetical protein